MKIFRWHTGTLHGRSIRLASVAGYAQLDSYGPRKPGACGLFGKTLPPEGDLHEVRIWRDGAEFEESASSYSSAIEAKNFIRETIGRDCHVIDSF